MRARPPQRIKRLSIRSGKPSQSAFIESFTRSFPQKALDAWRFDGVSEVQPAVEDRPTDYYVLRPQLALGSVPPATSKPGSFDRAVSTSELSM